MAFRNKSKTKQEPPPLCKPKLDCPWSRRAVLVATVHLRPSMELSQGLRSAGELATWPRRLQKGIMVASTPV